MAKDSGFNLVEMLNRRSKEQLKGSGIEEERREEDGKAAMYQEPERQEVMMIDVEDLIPSQDNFYRVDDSLKRSVEIVGILQPLLVSGPENGKYRVIAGHRRRLAALSLVKEGNESRRYVPCIYKREEVGDRLALIMANRFRDKSDWERMREIVEAEELARELKRDHGLEGRSRDLLAQIMGMSQAQIGRYKAIYNHLDQGLMEAFREGSLNFSTASELCGLPVEWQRRAERLMKVNGTLTLPEVKTLKEQKEKDEAAKRNTDRLSPLELSDCPQPNARSGPAREAIVNREVFLEISGEEGSKRASGKERLETNDVRLSPVKYGEIRGYMVKSDLVCQRRVYVCPVARHDGETGEEAYIKYGCPVCEMFGNPHSFSEGTANCPLCGINLRWERDQDPSGCGRKK